MGMANALIRKLHGGPDAQETRDDSSGDAPLHGAVPERLGRFEIEGRLGAGAMGVVYAARDPMLRRDVAIKVLSAERTSDVSLARARREAQAMAQLSHPNVVNVFAIGEHAGSLYIAMERIRGQTLSQWQAGSRSPSEILAVYRQAAQGLEALHQSGLVHRDFKPANAMRGDDGRVRVLDLGLVRELSQPSAPEGISGRGSGARLGSGSETLSDAVLGTPAYMAPEQFLGNQVGPAADQFSFCVALYEALYGHRPFPAKTMAQLVEAIASQRIEPPPAGSSVPHRVFRALRRGLASDPRRRHPSMESLVDALDGRSSRWAWFGAAALVGGVALSLGGAAPDPDACAVAEQFERSWTEARQAKRDGALYGLGRPAKALEARVTRACEAPASDSVKQCLSTLVERFDTVVRVLEDPPDGLNAEAVVSSLVAPSLCDNADELRGRQDELVALGVMLKQVDTLALAGAFDDALRLGHDAVAQAQALGQPTLQYEAFYQRGKVYARRRDLPEANADFNASYELALRLREDQAARNAADALVWVTQTMGDLDGAEHWLNVAQSAEEAITGKKGQGPRMLMRAGELDLLRGRLDTAAEKLTKSRARWRELGDGREEATALGILVDVHLQASNLDDALRDAKQAVDVLTAFSGDDEPQLGTHYLNLGVVHARRGELDEALVALAEAVARRSKAYGAEHYSTAVAGCEHASVLRMHGRDAEARELAERGRKLLPEGEPAASACELALAHLEAGEGRAAAAVEIANKAVVSLEAQLGADDQRLAEARWSLAEVELKVGHPTRALEQAALARRVFEGNGRPEHEAVGRCLEVEAAALVALARPAEAVPVLERAVGIMAKTHGASSPQVQRVRAALAAVRGT